MSRTTIDFGIDLGTTNSAVAVLNDIEPEIIKNNDDLDITSSAVWINRKGVVHVGSRAKQATASERDHANAFIEFKRLMGTPTEYHFEASGERRKPEDLSAEVLKALKAAVEARTGEVISSAVITVPAAFELHQCDATRQAATLAGLRACALVQEPVAAALAYGFQVDSEKAYWLVYDFGGGTFDAAIIKAEDGMINVVHHGGDNFLGGSDIDWAIVEQVIMPELKRNYDLPGFERGSERWKLEILRIKHAVETAKIDLSTKERTSLPVFEFEDASGETVLGDELELSRDDVVAAAKPLIGKSIDICKRILKEKNLDPSSLAKVIVVGGPTKAPYFRDLLASGLGVEIDFSQDPLTVVARGAAIFAGTQKMDKTLLKGAEAGEFQINISDKYKTVGHETDPLIAGKVNDSDGKPASGLSIEFSNVATKWRSGQVPLNADGAFMINLLADKGSRNRFEIKLTDQTGNQQRAVPDHVLYTVGAVIEEQPLLKSIGLGKADNSVDWFFKAGSGLPQKKRWNTPYRTTVTLEPGTGKDKVLIPIVEGEQDQADRNRVVGNLVIDSSMVRRTLPTGSDMEITLKISESRTLTLEAYFPLLDEEFTKQVDVEKESSNPDRLKELLQQEKGRMEKLREKAEDSNDDALIDQLDDLEKDRERDRLVKAAASDPAAAEKGQARILELQLELDRLEGQAEWPTQVQQARKLQEQLESLVDEHGDRAMRKEAEEWSESLERIIEGKKAERIKKKISEGNTIYFRVLASIPAFWVAQFQRMEGADADYSNPTEAERLLERGRGYLNSNNLEGLKDVVTRLWQLMPEKEVERMQRGVGATII
ncbi:MAG: Hsp70 family protein [Verrucomicrobiaceae bacterium]|nr:Hsp70 family protein [Verrucomicrobiaceae bacterium]